MQYNHGTFHFMKTDVSWNIDRKSRDICCGNRILLFGVKTQSVVEINGVNNEKTS